MSISLAHHPSFCNKNDSVGSSSDSATTECDHGEPLPTAATLDDEGSFSPVKNKNSRKRSNASIEAIEEDEGDKPAVFTEPFNDEEDEEDLPLADASADSLAEMAKDEKAREAAHRRAKWRTQRYISCHGGDAEEFPLGIFVVHSMGSGIGISVSEDGTQLFPLGLQISRLESYYGISNGKKRVVRCTLEVLPLGEAKQRNMIDCPCRVSKSGGSCIFSICIEGLQRGEGPRVIVDENLDLAWARVLRVLGKYEMAQELEDDVCERLEAKHIKAGKQRQPIDEEEMSLRSLIADLAEILRSVRQQAIAYRKLLTVLTYKQQDPIPMISDMRKLSSRRQSSNEKEAADQSNISTFASVGDNKQEEGFSKGLCIGGFLSPSLTRILESNEDAILDSHYIFTDHRLEERISGHCTRSLEDLCRMERESDLDLSWKESSWKARRMSLDKRKDGNTQRRIKRKRVFQDMTEMDYWGGEVKPEREVSGGGRGGGGGGGVNRRLEKLHERRRQKEMRDQAKEEEKYIRSVKRGFEGELTRRRLAARSLVQAAAEMEELRSLTGQTEEMVTKEDNEKQTEDMWLHVLRRSIPAPSGKHLSQNEAPGLQHVSFGARDVSDLVFVWDFLHVFQNRFSLCRPPPSLSDLSISLADAEALRLNLNQCIAPLRTTVEGGDTAANGKVVPKPPPTSREAQHSLELLHDVAGSITALLSGPLLENLALGITTFTLGGGGNKGEGISSAGSFAEGESAPMNSEAAVSPAKDITWEQMDVCSWPGFAIMNLLSYAYKEMGVDTYQKTKGNVYVGSPAFVEVDRRNVRLLRERMLLRWRNRARAQQRDDSLSLEGLNNDDNYAGGLELAGAAAANNKLLLPPLSSALRYNSSPSDMKVTIPIPSLPYCGPETWEFHAMCIADMDPEQVSVYEVMTVLRKGIRAASIEARGCGSSSIGGSVASKAIKPLLEAIKLCGPHPSPHSHREVKKNTQDDEMKVILACKAKVAESLKLKRCTTTSNNDEEQRCSNLTKFRVHPPPPPVFRSILPCKFNAADVSGYMNVTVLQHRKAVEAKEHYKTLALASVAALTQAVLEEEEGEDEGDIEVEVEDGEWVPEAQVKSEGPGNTAIQVGKSQNIWEIDQSLLLEHARNEMLRELNAAIEVEGISDSIKRCCRLILSLVQHPLGSPLIERVDPSSNNGYYDMVTRPLALRDIVDNLLNAVSRETSSATTDANTTNGGEEAAAGPLKNDDIVTLIVADVRHIFANALWFGGPSSSLWECATKLSFVFERLVFDWVVEPKAPSPDVLDDKLCQTCFSISFSSSSSASGGAASPSPPPTSRESPPPLTASQGDLLVAANDAEQQLLVCIRCEAKHHIKCAGVKRVPNGGWFCSNCISEKSLRDIDPLVGTIASLKTPSSNEEKHQTFIIKDVSWSADGYAYVLQPAFPSISRGSPSLCTDNPRESTYVLGSDLRSAFDLDAEAIANPSPRYLGIDTPGYAGWGGGTILPHSGRLPLGLNPLICFHASELDSTNPEFAAVGQAMAVLLSGESTSAQMGGKAWLAILSALSQASVGGLSEALSRSLMERESSALANAKGSLKEYQAVDTPQDVLSLPVNLRIPLREDLDEQQQQQFIEDAEDTEDIDEDASVGSQEEDGDYDDEEDDEDEEADEEEEGGRCDENKEPAANPHRKRRKITTSRYLDSKSNATNDSEDKMGSNGGGINDESSSGEETMGSGVERDESPQKEDEDEFGREEGEYLSSIVPQANVDGVQERLDLEQQQQQQQQQEQDGDVKSESNVGGDLEDEETGAAANDEGKTAPKNVKSLHQRGGSKSSLKVSPLKKKPVSGTIKAASSKSQLGRRPPFEDDLLLHAVVDEVSKAIDKVAAKEAMQRVDPTFLGPGEGGGPLTEAAALITSSPTPVMCAYCDLPEIFLCSPFVWSQSWHEALMLRLGTSKVEMVLEMEEDSDYRKSVLQLVKEQLGVLGLTPVDNANLYRDPFRCVWCPQNSDLAQEIEKQPYDFIPGGINSLGDDSSVIFVPKGSVIAHDCCARAMVTHRNYSQSKLVLKMRKEAVESAAHLLAGDRTQPVGVDCMGRLYWVFTHRPGHVFVEPGSNGAIMGCKDWIVLDNLEDLAMLCLRLDARNAPELDLVRGILRYNPPLLNALCDDKFMRKLCSKRVPNDAADAVAITGTPAISHHTVTSSTSNAEDEEKNGINDALGMEGVVEEEPPPPKCSFAINSGVLVRPRSPEGLWYAARVIHCHGDGSTFTVSFNGWPQRFNTRVYGSRLALDDDENAMNEAKTSFDKWLGCVEASGLSVPSGIPGLVTTAHLNAGNSVNKGGGGCPAAPVFRQEEIMSNMLVMAKASLLTIGAALPDGALLLGRGWNYEGGDSTSNVPAGSCVDVDAEEGGRSGWFSENWTRAVNEAQTAEELMEACIILESSISTRWLHGHFEEGLQHLLSPRSIALRFPNFSDVALRVWVIDKAILYDFSTAPPRAAMGRSGRNRVKGKLKGGGSKKR